MADSIAKYVGSPTLTVMVTTAGAGTVDIPPWAQVVTMSGVSSGGGAAGSSATVHGAGGGGGSSFEFTLPTSVFGGTTISYNLGTFGTGGAASTSGTDGTDSTITVNTTTITISAGLKGNFNASGGNSGTMNLSLGGPTRVAGGAGGVAGTGSSRTDQFVYTGGGGGGGGVTAAAGGSGNVYSGGVVSGGGGGSTAYGGGPRTTATTTGQTPDIANCGAGGQGAVKGSSGFTGGNGKLGHIKFYFEGSKAA